MRKNILVIIAFLILLAAAAFCYAAYRMMLGPNMKSREGKAVLYIPEGSSFSQVLDTINEHLTVSNPEAFKWLAAKKNYTTRIKPGKYVVENDISYNGLINLLRSGQQTPVNVTFNNIRTLNELAGRVGKQISADSAGLADFFSDPANYVKDGFKKETLISVFIPDTYQMYWNTGPEDFYKRMLREYNTFWNEERAGKATGKNLTRTEVSTLASIIDEEVRFADEMPRIAGVYLNRLRRGIPLQADPTIKFAMNDPSISRVLKAYLDIDSPYNTYRYRGLPPGPISCPSVEAIDAVLNAEMHDYLYFAARADFSGYHNFTRTLSEHNRYAAEYQRELNKRRIFR
ncbi:MAG: endolytic transglycosylase MltG [Bacteroidales bacterium]|jgi:UPF0755 protein|nr:endolytic transglycosylase MltG [Bacteroidales bacterium]